VQIVWSIALGNLHICISAHLHINLIFVALK
jgi:hypothetical protein